MRKPRAYSGFYGSREPRYLASTYNNRQNNYSNVARNFLFGLSRFTKFLPGVIDLPPISIRLTLVRTSIQPGSDIQVQGNDIRLVVQRVLSFNDGAVNITGADIEINLIRRSLVFQSPPTIPVESPGFSLRPTLRRTAFNSGSILVEGRNFGLTPVVTFTLPELTPSARQFQPPRYAVINTKAENGLTHRRFLASKPAGATMRLTYENVPDSQATFFLDIFDESKGGLTVLNLPEATFASADSSLRAFMMNPHPDLVWTFAEAPRVRFIKQGVCNIDIALVARLIDRSPPLSIQFSGCVKPFWDGPEPAGPYSVDTFTPPDCSMANQTGC